MGFVFGVKDNGGGGNGYLERATGGTKYRGPTRPWSGVVSSWRRVTMGAASNRRYVRKVESGF